MTTNLRRQYLTILMTLVTTAVLTTPATTQAEPTETEVTRTLGIQLTDEGLHPHAATEFRRLALLTGSDTERASAYLAAALAYVRDGKHDLALAMLDQAEASSPGVDIEARVLRADVARAREQWDIAAFHLEGLTNHDDETLRHWAVAHLSAVHVASEFPAAAAEVLRKGEAPAPALQALALYQAGTDKSPRLGGILGLLPGLGHAYAGEYGNALRSLIVNSLFIYAMVDTAGDEQWGAFTAITFFELTWYTGSVYGGIDAVHRHNAARRQAAIDAISPDRDVRFRTRAVPVLSVEMTF